jgi:hypothetical protein
MPPPPRIGQCHHLDGEPALDVAAPLDVTGPLNPPAWSALLPTALPTVARHAPTRGAVLSYLSAPRELFPHLGLALRLRSRFVITSGTRSERG